MRVEVIVPKDLMEELAVVASKNPTSYSFKELLEGAICILSGEIYDLDLFSQDPELQRMRRIVGFIESQHLENLRVESSTEEYSFLKSWRTTGHLKYVIHE